MREYVFIPRPGGDVKVAVIREVVRWEWRRVAVARALVEHVQANGGRITERDLAEYRVVRRRPVRAEFRGDEFLSNPPPSAGGTLIAYGLGLLEDVGAPGSAEAIDALARVMRAQADASGWPRQRLSKLLEERAVVSSGTTHISVVDGGGNAVALTGKSMDSVKPVT